LIRVKICSTSLSNSKPYDSKAVLAIRTPPKGINERLNGLSVWKPTICSISLSKYQKYLPDDLRKKMVADYVYDTNKTRDFVKSVSVELLKIY